MSKDAPAQFSPWRDDAGKPLPTVPPEVFQASLWGENLPLGLFVIYRVLPWVGVGWFVFELWWSGFKSMLPGILSACVVIAVMAISVRVRVWRLQRAGRVPSLPLPPSVALLAAHRRCGACGYSLFEAPPQPDGLTVCPECGAAWNPDRWTMADLDPKESFSALKQLSPVTATDDRGVPLSRQPTTPPSWIDGPHTPWAPGERLERRIARWRRTRALIAAPIAAVLWVALTACAVIKDDPLPRELFSMIIGWGLMLGGLLGVALYVVARLSISTRRLRRWVLDEALCLGCGHELKRPIEGAPPTFDGCIACERCRRAWRQDDIVWASPAPQGLPARTPPDPDPSPTG